MPNEPWQDQPEYPDPSVWAPVPDDFRRESFFMSIVPDGPVWRPGPCCPRDTADVGNYRTLDELAAHPPADCGYRVYAVILAPLRADPTQLAFAWREVATDGLA